MYITLAVKDEQPFRNIMCNAWSCDFWFIPITRLNAEVVPLVGAALEADAGHGGEGVKTTLNDRQLAGSCRSSKKNT